MFSQIETDFKMSTSCLWLCNMEQPMVLKTIYTVDKLYLNVLGLVIIVIITNTSEMMLTHDGPLIKGVLQLKIKFDFRLVHK